MKFSFDVPVNDSTPLPGTNSIGRRSPFSMLQALSGKPARSWCKGWNLVLGFLLWCGFEAVGKGPGHNPLRGTETFIGYEPKS